MIPETIEFKSASEYFYDEKSGLKNNTVRNLDITDERFWNLMRQWKDKNYGSIRINLAGHVHTDSNRSINQFEDKMYSFMRRIKHVAIFNDLVIITWETNEGDD